MRQKKTYPCSLNAAFLSCCPNLLRSYSSIVSPAPLKCPVWLSLSLKELNNSIWAPHGIPLKIPLKTPSSPGNLYGLNLECAPHTVPRHRLSSPLFIELLHRIRNGNDRPYLLSYYGRKINQHTGIGIKLMKWVGVEKPIPLPGPEHPADG